MFCEAVDNGKEVRTVFCDISKAFDRVWHKSHYFINYEAWAAQRRFLSGFLAIFQDENSELYSMVNFQNGSKY